MSKQFWAVVAVVIILFVGVAVVTNRNKDDVASNGSAASTTNHVKGAGTTDVTLVEYGDFQCPYCQTYHATVKQVLADYGDQIKFQFVNYPLTSLHQNAFAASRAAEAADKQGKFWEMYDLIYQNNDPSGRTGWVASSTPTEYFEQYATQIGLNAEKFKTDSKSAAVNAAINADLAKGKKLGIEGTPTFYLNGKKATIANTAGDFKKVIDAAIAAKPSARDGGGRATSNE